MGDDERVLLAKKRRAYITGIRKGDFYSLRNAPEDALAYYLTVQENLPDDQIIRKKIAHIYYVMKNWSRAYAEYVQVPISELSEEEKNEMLSALYFDDMNFDRIGEISKIKLQSGTLDYFKIVDMCYAGADPCTSAIENYTGSEYRITWLEEQIVSAKKLSEDQEYKNLLLAAKLYTLGMYRASEKILSDILAERPDYLEVKKILGFSLYELGKYEWAKRYILEYLEKNPNDLESIVRMGEISSKIGNLVSSNLYLNNAITAWYQPKTDLERRLAYNYSQLWDTVGMIKVINYLLQEPDATEDDFAVGMSLAITDGQYTRAISWGRIGVQKFRDSRILTPLYIQALRLEGEIDAAVSLLQNTPLEAMTDNPNFLLEKAILTTDLWSYEEAKDMFRELAGLEDWPDIVDEARLYLDRLSTNL
jgi:tetratricopeptide (TPR) repeat protein